MSVKEACNICPVSSDPGEIFLSTTGSKPKCLTSIQTQRAVYAASLHFEEGAEYPHQSITCDFLGGHAAFLPVNASLGGTVLQAEKLLVQKPHRSIESAPYAVNPFDPFDPGEMDMLYPDAG